MGDDGDDECWEKTWAPTVTGSRWTSISVGFEAVYIGVKFKELGRLFAARLSLETRILAQGLNPFPVNRWIRRATQ